MQKQKSKSTTIKLKRMRSGTKAQAIMNAIAMHYLSNQEAIRQLNLKQKRLRQEIEKRATGKSATYRTDIYEVQFAVWFREQLVKKEKFEAAFGRNTLKRLKLLKNSKVTEITVRDMRKTKK